MTDMKDINLIRKIAWKFFNNSHSSIEWDDLFQEACLAYLQALKRYDPKRGKLSTFMWHAISSHLLNYLKQEKDYHNPISSIDTMETEPSWTPYNVENNNKLDQLSDQASMIVNIIIESSDKIMYDGKQAKRQVMSILREKKWSWKSIWDGMIELQKVFNT